MGPNIRYAFREYWDYFDHQLPLSDLSVVEGLIASGFNVNIVIPRFLPFTMNNGTLTWPFNSCLYSDSVGLASFR